MITTEINLRSLKFAILKCLAPGGHQHKFNFIGKGYSPGSLEFDLRIQFNPDQRHLAVIAFDELAIAGLIRPTYTDLVNPEQWVEITDAGRRALERQQLDALNAALGGIATNLVEIRDGAWAAVYSGRPDGVRQAAHSARELINQTLKIGAPDEIILVSPWFTPDVNSHSGVTRRHRLRYLMETRRGGVSESELKVAEKACDLVLVSDERLTAIAHSRNRVATSDVRDALLAAEIALRRILLPEEVA